MSRLIDLTGQKFGSRTVLRRVPAAGQQAHWLVRCDCGKEDVVPSQRLRNGGGNGCRKCGRATYTKLIDLTGQCFGRWKVLSRAKRTATTLWKVKCECGRVGEVAGQDLRSGHSKSCKSCGSTKYWNRMDLQDPDWCWLLGLFHGDGSTVLFEDGGGAITFACMPPENQTVITETLERLEVPYGITKNGINIYSVRLAEDFRRFKISGLGQEKWMMPDKPVYWGEWLAGLLDSDGGVSKDGRGFYFYQKAHGGLDFVRQVLEKEEIFFSTNQRGRRGNSAPQETIQIRAVSREKFKALVHPRFPKKRLRASQRTLSRLQDLTGRRFGKRVALHHLVGSRPSKWMTRCDCGLVMPVGTAKLLSGKSHACRKCSVKTRAA